MSDIPSPDQEISLLREKVKELENELRRCAAVLRKAELECFDATNVEIVVRLKALKERGYV